MAPKGKSTKAEQPAAKPTTGKAVAGKGKAQVAKALDAKKKVIKGPASIIKKKVRTYVRFRRPKTLSLPKSPKYVSAVAIFLNQS